MINDAIVNYTILFLLLEFYEVSWQKAPTIMGMVIKMHVQYIKNIFLFLLMQPTFYFAIGFVMITDYAPSAMILLFIKTVDIATKILLIEQVFIKKELSQEMSQVLLAPINSFLPYIGFIVYPPLIFLAI